MSDNNFEYARVIGEKLRTARQAQHMSLRDLAEKASISASMLSQIETGKASPSVRSIYSIATALALPIDYFFPDDKANHDTLAYGKAVGTDEMTASEMREATINRASNGSTSDFTSHPIMAQVLNAALRPTIRLRGGVTWERLTANAEPDVEFLEITYAPDASSGEKLSHHGGREFGLVVEGELVVQLGFKQITLRAGDSIVFDSTTPHRLWNNTDEPMRAMWVVWNRD
jgi:transcriptional regulator with XRE-family HTH domain/quercetin dioxygenase-like cupin family protein